MRLCAFVAVAFCFVLTSAVSAATVTAVTGKVSINRGDGFAQISSATSAKPGDRVMAGFGGTAEIVYDNGCRQKVESGSLITVVETPPCEKPTVSQDGGWVTQTTEEQKTNLWPYALGLPLLEASLQLLPPWAAAVVPVATAVVVVLAVDLRIRETNFNVTCACREPHV